MLSKTITALFTVAALASVAVPAHAFELPPPSSAQPVPTDEVRLVSGGFIRGEIVEYVPGSYVDIVPKGTTTSRRVLWDDISEVVRGQAGAVEGPAPQPVPMPTPAPAPAPQVQPEPQAQAEPQAQVQAAPPTTSTLIHIDQLPSRHDRPVILYHVDGEAVAMSSSGYSARAVAFSEVCESPCDLVVDNHRGEFFVGGDKYTGSKRFRLSGDHARYDLRVQPRSKGMLIGGYVLASMAPFLASSMIAIPFLRDMPKSYARGFWAGGSLIGIFALGGGITMMILGRTKVTVIPGSRR